MTSAGTLSRKDGCHDRTRSNSVATDSLLTVLSGNVLGQANDSRFRCAVGALESIPSETSDRGGVDDRTAAGDERMWQRQL